MLKSIASFSVRYPTTIIMIVLGIILLGIISFDRLNIDLLPDLNSPRLFVTIDSSDKPPEEMETQYVSDIEGVAARLSKVESVSSVTRVGKAVVTVEYSWSADMDEAFLDLQKSLATFTQGSSDVTVTVSTLDPNASPVMVLAFSHPEIDDLDQLRRTAENIIRNDLIRLEGVASVDILGGRQRQVSVDVDSYLLEAFGFSVDNIASTIQNYNRNLSGGSIVEMGRRYIIKGVSEFSSVSDIRDLIIGYKVSDSTAMLSRTPVYLKDVASVGLTLSEPENIVDANGIRCLGLEVYKEMSTNTLKAVEALNEELEVLRKSLPEYSLTVISDQASFIGASITEVEHTGLIGIVLAVLVLFVFLRRIGVTTVISVAIPISVVATFNLMFFNDLSLNIMTLGGLALGAGMLVDNAIVVMENIFRNAEEGLPIKEAAVKGTAQIGGAIISSTLTTIIVFLPIVYIHGTAGELFKDQAWTVAFSLISSLFVALLVIPMLASKILRKTRDFSEQKSIRFPRYAGFLQNVIHNRGKVLAGAVLAIVLAFITIPMVGSEFIPRSDQGEFQIRLGLPEGTSLDRTAAVSRTIESVVKQVGADDIASIYTKVGPTNATPGESSVFEDENSARITVVLNKNRARSTGRFVDEINSRLELVPDLEFEIIQQQTALQMTIGTDEAPFVVEIKGEDLETLVELTDTVKSMLGSVVGITNLETSFEGGRPEIDIQIDRTVASSFSLTTSQIAEQIRDILSGRDVGRMAYQGDYADIMIEQAEISVSQLANLPIEASGGRLLKLGELSRIVRANAPREIPRNNQSRIGRVTAQLKEGARFDRAIVDAEATLAGLTLPSDYSISFTGEEEKRREAFSELGFALLLAIVLVYMVMAAQFESLLSPFVIILTLPLAGVGAVFGLLITGIQFSIMSYIGIIMLAGIAVNDSIILVDCTNQLRRSGLSLTDAIIKAGEMRIRPIIMTSVTTLLALLPLTFGIGEAASLRSPMAVAVISGLVTSTLLTLVVIPVVYYYISGMVRVRSETSA